MTTARDVTGEAVRGLAARWGGDQPIGYDGVWGLKIKEAPGGLLMMLRVAAEGNEARCRVVPWRVLVGIWNKAAPDRRAVAVWRHLDTVLAGLLTSHGVRLR